MGRNFHPINVSSWNYLEVCFLLGTTKGSVFTKELSCGKPLAVLEYSPAICQSIRLKIFLSPPCQPEEFFTGILRCRVSFNHSNMNKVPCDGLGEIVWRRRFQCGLGFSFFLKCCQLTADCNFEYCVTDTFCWTVTV